MNPVNGGIYEHRLASMMGCPNEMRPNRLEGEDGYPSPTFIEAAKTLEDQGYVKRLVRKEGYPIMGLQHTRKGLERAEYLKSRWPYRVAQFKTNANPIISDYYNRHKDELKYATIFAIICGLLFELIKMNI